MDDREFMDYVAERVTTRLRPLLNDEDFESVLRQSHDIDSSSEGYSWDISARIKLEYLGFDLYNIAWNVQKIATFPKEEDILPYLNSKGILPQATVKTYKDIDLSSYDGYINCSVSEDFSVIIGIDKDSDMGIPVEVGQTLETALDHLLDHVVKQYQTDDEFDEF
ncbi:hypothetical protein CMO88_02545 [Candidatus Woesearchaeota archaeon]|nr:hypothetical protein [Candidatus Woesearchaeota archaeon]|tara:strand:- start:1932 stop:2426 length:495 start_codon:yes stop_codon:yes gene_type:complete